MKSWIVVGVAMFLCLGAFGGKQTLAQKVTSSATVTNTDPGRSAKVAWTGKAIKEITIAELTVGRTGDFFVAGTARNR